MRTSISKKLLAGALSVMMVLSLVAPTGAQAASKYSLTDKKTVKADTTYKYQLKGVKKTQYVKIVRNVSGETVKYNKKAVVKSTKIKGTGKTLKLFVKYSEKNKNYSGKFTVKIFNKKTNKVAKKIVETVTVKTQKAAKVAVTGVALSTTTPKVGDTITATVAPANATNVTYAWYMGDSATQVETAIEGQTAATLTVTDAMVGKFIKVVVNGDNGSSATAITTAGVEAAATEKIAIVSAKQVGAAKIEVTFNKAFDKAAYNVTLAKGTAKQDVTVTVGETTTVATLETGVALSAGEYTVTATSKTDATETTESKVVCEKAELKKIDFLGNELILTSSKMDAAAVVVKGFNQFEEEVALSGSLKPYTTKGTATYSQKDSKINVAAGANTFFTVGESVTITAVYTAGSTILQISKPLTVSNVATLTKFEVGELATTKAALKGKRVTLDNFKTNTYYLPVKVAEDQYGNKLSASDLEGMRVKAGDNKGNLYVTPNTSAGSYAYVTGFEKLDDGTTAMKLAIGGISKPGKAIISITGVSGFSGTTEVTIEDNPFIATLSVTAPNLYAQVPATLEVSAVDQYGDAINLYDYVKAGEATAVTTGEKVFSFEDKNGLTDAKSSITIPKGANLKVTRDTSKKTAAFVYTPAARTEAGNDIITVQTAAPNVSNLTWSVETTPTPAGIKGLKIGTALAKKGTKTLDSTTVQILDNNNAVIDYTNTKVAPVTFTTVAPTKASTGYFAVVSSKATDKVTATGTAGVTLTGKAAGTSVITITLYFADGKNDPTTLATKDFTFEVSEGKFKSYKVSGDGSLLYVNASSTDKAGFYVYGVDANGVELATKDYTVTVDSDLTVSGQKVLGKKSGVGSKGTAIATIWAVVDGDDKATAVGTVDIPYDVAAPAPQGVGIYKVVTDADGNDNYLPTTEDTFDNVTDLKLTDGYVVFVSAGNVYYVEVADQYDQTMATATWSLDGKSISEKKVTGNGHALQVTSGKVNGSWTLNAAAAGFTPSVATEQTVKTFAALEAALAGADDTIVLGATIDAKTEDLTIPAGKSFVIPSAYDLKVNDFTNAGGEDCKVTISGSLETNGNVNNQTKSTITVNGAWTATGGMFTNAGTINGSGHLVIDGMNVTNTNGTFTVTGNSTVFKGNVTVTGGTLQGHIVNQGGTLTLAGTKVTLGGDIEIQTGINFANVPTVLTAGTTLNMTGATIANASALSVKENSAVEIINSAGNSTKLENSTAVAQDTVIPDSTAGQDNKPSAITEKVKKPDFVPEITVLKDWNNVAAKEGDLDGLYEGVQLVLDSNEWDEETGVWTYKYVATGTLYKNAPCFVGAPCLFGSDGSHGTYGFGIAWKAGDTSIKKIRVGSDLKIADNKPVEGWYVPATTAADGFVKGFKSATSMTVQYITDGGAVINCVVDLTQLTLSELSKKAEN